MEPSFDNPSRPSGKRGQPSEKNLEDLFLENDSRTRKPTYDSDTQLQERNLRDREVEIWELDEKRESNRFKRTNYRIILVSAIIGAAVPNILACCMFAGIIKSNDLQKSQAFTASVGIVISILGFLAGYNAP